jgi:hypothetical protein
MQFLYNPNSLRAMYWYTFLMATLCGLHLLLRLQLFRFVPIVGVSYSVAPDEYFWSGEMYQGSVHCGFGILCGYILWKERQVSLGTAPGVASQSCVLNAYAPVLQLQLIYKSIWCINFAVNVCMLDGFPHTTWPWFFFAIMASFIIGNVYVFLVDGHSHSHYRQKKAT